MKNGMQRIHLNLAAFTKAPPTPFESENNTGQQSGLPEEKSRRETEARQLRSAATKGSRHECPQRPGAPGPSFLKSNKFLYKIPHAHTCARSEVGGRGDYRPGVGSEVATPGSEGGDRARFLGRDESGSRDSQLAGARGGGARRRAHSTPAANSPHKVGFVLVSRDRRGDSPAWSGRGSRPSRRTSG